MHTHSPKYRLEYQPCEKTGLVQYVTLDMQRAIATERACMQERLKSLYGTMSGYYCNETLHCLRISDTNWMLGYRAGPGPVEPILDAAQCIGFAA